MLLYESTGKLSVSAAQKIVGEAAAIHRAWWRGGVGFEGEAIDAPVVLTGTTPLFHRSSRIPDPDDLYMAFADAAFILDRLADWARRFKVKWHVRMHDEDWGAIDPSGFTKPLLDQMEKWAHRVRIPSAGKGAWRVDETRRAELAARHAARPQ